MLAYDADLSVNLHFEISEEEAIASGGVSLPDVKRQIEALPDWIMNAIMEYVEFNENDSITVIPYENKVTLDGKIINLDDIEDDDDEEDESENGIKENQE